jgi:hypothetical protein
LEGKQELRVHMGSHITLDDLLSGPFKTKAGYIWRSGLTSVNIIERADKVSLYNVASPRTCHIAKSHIVAKTNESHTPGRQLLEAMHCCSPARGELGCQVHLPEAKGCGRELLSTCGGAVRNYMMSHKEEAVLI